MNRLLMLSLAMKIYADDIKLIEQRYPRAGTNNARVDLATINLKTDKVRYLELDKSAEYYLPRLKWTPDGQKFAYQWQSRDHKNLSLMLYDTKKRKQKTLLREQSSAWINLHDDLHFLRGNRGFVWASERSGYKHLYRYDMNGNLRAQLTKGEWIVDQLEGVDEKNNWVYFTGRADTPLEKTPIQGAT